MGFVAIRVTFPPPPLDQLNEGVVYWRGIPNLRHMAYLAQVIHSFIAPRKYTQVLHLVVDGPFGNTVRNTVITESQ